MRKLFIWGAGVIGKRVHDHLSGDWEITFVDSNKQLIGSDYYGKKVINIDEYLKEYSKEFILISHLREEESIEVLKANHINNYFVHCNLPGEFKEPYIRDILERYITNYLRDRTDYVLYGLDLYSIIIDEWIYKNFGKHPYILLQENVSEDFINKIRQQYAGLRIINSIQSLNEIKEICICVDNYVKSEKDNRTDHCYLTDLFDCSNKIDDYHNAEIEKFHNIHQGQRCFIVATGPSLRMDDLDLLKREHEICISMNHIFQAFAMTDWRPDYYVMDDWTELRDNKTRIDTWKSVKAKFVGDTLEEFWKVLHGEDVYCYHKNYEYCINRLPKFSDDFSRRSYASGTVTYTCLQLAAYMGFKKIYLLGVDFTYGGQQKNINYGHFYKEDKLEGIGFVKQVTSAYESAKKYADAHGMEIYNATRGGKLEIFERVEFDRVFV